MVDNEDYAPWARRRSPQHGFREAPCALLCLFRSEPGWWAHQQQQVTSRQVFADAAWAAISSPAEASCTGPALSAARSVNAEASTAAKTPCHRCLTVAFIDASTGKDFGSMDTGGPRVHDITLG